MTHRPDTAVVVGVGASDGLGAGIARRFAKAGLTVFVAGRTRDRLETVVAEMRAAGQVAHAAVVDATDPGHVERIFADASKEGRLTAAIFNAGNNQARPLLHTDPAFFESVWRVTCFAGHLFAVQAARHLLPHGGTALFTGASASMRGVRASRRSQRGRRDFERSRNRWLANLRLRGFTLPMSSLMAELTAKE